MIQQPTYGVAARLLEGRVYDTDHAELIAAHHHIHPYSGMRECEAHLWRTTGGHYFNTGFRFCDHWKWLNPLRRREAYHWLLKADELELAKIHFTDLPLLLSASEGHPELPMSINTRDVWLEDFEIRPASLVWWQICDLPDNNLEGLYVTDLRRFFIAEYVQFSSSEFTHHIRSVYRDNARQWLFDAGVRELAEYYFPSTKIRQEWFS